MKKIIQLWAVVVSLFAVFTVSGAASAAPLGTSASDGGYCDCAEPCDTPPAQPVSRRRHSDIV